MINVAEAGTSWPGMRKWGRWFASKLGVSSLRKEEIYLDLLKSATLRDPSYWLQILFAAGIATLGLVQNSPAVIIGAMLISPLMGPILAGGLALAAGDLILAVRAAAVLALSCAAAIMFSVLLVGLMPFKEMTGEIAARTEPNTLDLVVALFSGAVGSIALCKEVKGVVTSIPGVAIAVALMPPLCVVGYGVGLALSLDAAEGIRTARGGGLLFLTNLAAITLTSMTVFFVLHIAEHSVRERALEWRRTDVESERIQQLLNFLRLPKKVGIIGGVWGRFLIILIPILLILIPLSRSLGHLKQEYARKREENKIRRIAVDSWQARFSTLPDGSQRAVLDRMAISEASGKVTLAMRIFTSQPYSPPEKEEFTRQVAQRLGKPIDRIETQFLEIPTAAGLLAARAQETSRIESTPSIAQLRASFRAGMHEALSGVRLPSPLSMVEYQVLNSSTGAMQVEIFYLGDHEIAPDAASLIAEDVRIRLIDPSVAVKCSRIPDMVELESSSRNPSTLTPALADKVDLAGEILQRHPQLLLEIALPGEGRERPGTAAARAQAIGEHLQTKWRIASERIEISTGNEIKAAINLRIKKP